MPDDTQYRAQVCEAYLAQPRLVEQLLSPAPLAAGEIRVRNSAFAVGFPDLLTMQGKYQRKPQCPFVPGSEFCGEVIERGAAVTQFKPGDRVIGSVMLGAYAEQVIAKADACSLLPAPLSVVQGATFLTAYKTAYVGLVERGKLRKGEWLLVLGAAGGVGLAAVELGVLLGATVIAAASTPAKREAALRAGANYVVDYTMPDWRDAVKALTDGRGVDVIYDPVGGDLFDEAIRCLAYFGRYLVIGFADGRIPTLQVNYALIKQIAVIGVRAGEFGRLNIQGGERVRQALLRLGGEAKLCPYVHAEYRFDETQRALQEVSDRSVIGRVAVRCDN